MEQPVTVHRRTLVWAAVLTALCLIGSLTWVLVGARPAAAAAHAICPVPSSAYPTLQGAVDDPACDTVHVAAGVYASAVTISRSVVITGTGPNATVLDGENSRRPLTILGSGIAVTVRDLTIRNGNATAATGAQAMGGAS